MNSVGEIDGKVPVLERAVISAEDDRVELLERLAAIEAKLDKIQRDAQTHLLTKAGGDVPSVLRRERP
jgi:DNA-directed RNA polymerase subunit H (RpoH/RPB5)